MATEKRQRQKAGRQARLAAEQKAHKRRTTTRRLVVAVVAAAVFGISSAIFAGIEQECDHHIHHQAQLGDHDHGRPGRGAGNKSPSAITTSADCPANFTTTLNKPSYPAYPPMTINPSKTYTATVTTDIGPFTIQLDPKVAPKAVNSFVFLADQHFFDCIIFHRVIPSFVDQTGDPTGTGTGGPGYHFADELPKTATPQYPLGSVAMANSRRRPTPTGASSSSCPGRRGRTWRPTTPCSAR